MDKGATETAIRSERQLYILQEQRIYAGINSKRKRSQELDNVFGLRWL